ncbi:Putative ribosome-binding factor A, mitochondrial [Apodemus speciosus]|uniref:Ribosome-binding factor A, mitochondrial n=1 Tax=Apodemus speciosus TaxID=105296 RepID=A0ABQ0FRP5_APOSI
MDWDLVKKFWYDGPSLGSHLTPKSSRYEFLTKNTFKKTRKEDSIRLRVLNGLLYKSLSELLCTPEVSQEVYDLNVELSKVSVTSDFSACRVYWKTGVSAEQNRHTEAVLQRSAAYMRKKTRVHLLISQQTLRNVPPIVFVQDKRDIVLAEVDRLLAVADFGPPDERDDLDGLRNPGAQAPHDSPEPSTHPNLCGIDHEALNKQIMEYKRKKERGLQCMSPVPPSGLEQAPHPTRLLQKRKKAGSRQRRNASPRSFLLGEEDEDEDSSTEWECHAHEAEDEWGAEHEALWQKRAGAGVEPRSRPPLPVGQTAGRSL